MANLHNFQNATYSLWEIPFFMLIGLIGGVLGALFNYLNVQLAKFRKK